MQNGCVRLYPDELVVHGSYFFGEGHDFDIPLEKLGEGGKMEGRV